MDRLKPNKKYNDEKHNLTARQKNSIARLREISRQFLGQLDKLGSDDADQFWLEIARTDIQTACNAACRAVENSDKTDE
ncbi:hypothetical protein Entas_4485 (plasmid) [Enterobacter soli]|uniref:Acb2/Tad1 domain-containing protein n=1 Tax=Enterobacter soli TaxID=885040 RepID=UPI000223CE5E|nr:hypothetical protein [Enterobacter soli]AEN67180.1 hypothetical protein Entas_4485 [Enterobacter soli]OAT35092.1 hypothetical protein M987_04545 [Enterobacter soli ATCC BAA-2102]